ncbi:MAG TPA: DedA family protein [Novosphingobium sp.]|nr:DedA family protein [Novosphingobium sp.]
MFAAGLLVSLVHRLGVIGVALGAGLEGETAVVLGGTAAQRGLFSPIACAVAAWLGSFLADQFVFWLSREQRQRPFVQKLAGQPRVGRALGVIDRHPWLFCFGFRFVYGFRIAGPAAVGLSAVPGRVFVGWNALSAAVWAAVFTFMGYRFGDALLAAVRPLLHLPHIGVELGVVAVVLALLWIGRAKR